MTNKIYHVDAIETKEIRGMSLRTLATLIVCTISICTTVMGSYFSLNSDIKDLKVQKDQDEKYNDLRLRTLEIRVSATEVQYKELSTRYEELLGEKYKMQK
jgi:hypothetical protein